MRLDRLRVRRMPGIEREFELGPDLFRPGLNVVLGPNGSGKTTVCRAVRALLWPRLPGPRLSGARATEPGDVSVSARWRMQDEVVEARSEGRGRTEWENPASPGLPAAPDLPEPHHAHCYFLGIRDLLLETRGDADLAREIRRQMSGGFDLDRVCEEIFELRPRTGAAERRKLDEAEQNRRTVRAAQEQLARQVDGELPELERRLKSARAATKRGDRLRQVGELRRLEADRVAVGKELARFPASMNDLSSIDAQRLRDLETLRASQVTDLARVEQQLRDAARDEAQAGPDAGDVTARDLDLWDGRVRELDRVEGDLDRRVQEACEKAKATQLARAALGSEDCEPSVDAASLRSVERLLGRRAAALGEQESLGRYHASLLKQRSPAEDASLRDAALELAGLHGATGQTDAGSHLPWGLLVLACAVGAAVGVVAGGWAEIAGWALAALGVFALLRLLRPRPGPAAPETVVEPDSGVLEVLRHLSARDRATEVSWCEREVARVGRDVEEAAREAAQIRDRLGVDPRICDFDLVRLVRAVGQLRLCRDGEAAADEAVDRAERQRGVILEELAAAHGRFADARDGAAVRSVHLSLGRDRDTILSARAVAAAARDAESELERTRAETEEQRAELYARAQVEVGDREELDRRLAGVEDFADAKLRASQSDVSIKAARGRLTDHDEMLTLDPDGLRDALANAEDLSREQDALTDQVAELEVARRHAEEGHALADARRERDEAQDRLRERRDEALHATAGRFLLDRARSTHEEASQPAVLRKARDLFARFTRRRYDLRLGDGDEFRAWDAVENRGQSLSQLSDGTRCQLLLAVRLAFAFAAERGARPPVFLDEALGVSDPDRFDAVVEALVLVVREEGRQIFYLTSNPADVVAFDGVLKRMGEPLVEPLDIAAARRVAVAASREILAPPPRRTTPEPGDMNARDYAVKIGIPKLEPAGPPSAVDLWYLLREDLPLLYHLREDLGLETIGQWRGMASVPAALGVDEESSRALSARCDVVESFFRHRAVGRGTAVNREALVASGAVSDVFLDRVTALAERLGGDARGLIDALRTSQVPRFHSDKTRLLGEYLVESGHLDDRTPYGADTLTARVLFDTAAAISTRIVTPGTVTALVRDMIHFSAM